ACRFQYAADLFVALYPLCDSRLPGDRGLLGPGLAGRDQIVSVYRPCSRTGCRPHEIETAVTTVAWAACLCARHRSAAACRGSPSEHCRQLFVSALSTERLPSDSICGRLELGGEGIRWSSRPRRPERTERSFRLE